MAQRLETMPALPLAAGALIAALALEARSTFEYIVLAAFLAAGIFLIFAGGRRAISTLAVGIVVTIASFFFSRSPEISREWLGCEAEYTLYIEDAGSGAKAQRCTATAMARNGEECSRFRCRLTVIDLPGALQTGEIVSTTAIPEPIGIHSDVPFMESETMFARASGISASLATISEHISIIGYHNSVSNRLASLRRSAADAIYSTGLSEEAAAVLVTALLGSDTPPESVRESFRDSGIAHLLCISGFHIGVIAWIISLLLFPLRLWTNAGRWRYPAVAVIVWLYVALIGFPPSATRASIMLSAYFMAKMLQRGSSSYNTLALAVAMLLFVQPRWLFDAGFQLSVCAVLGLLLFATKLNPISTRHQRWRNAATLITVPLAAMLGTAPILLVWFHRLPLLTVPANALASLFFPPFMIVGILFLLLAAIGVQFHFLAALLQWLLELMKAISNIAESNISLYLDDLSIILLSAAILIFALALYARKWQLWLLFGANICSLTAVSYLADMPSGGFVVSGNDKYTQVCAVDDNGAYIYCSRRRPIYKLNAFIKGCGINPDSVRINPEIETPIVLATRHTAVEHCHSAYYLIIDRSFKGSIAALLDSVKPSVVVLGKGVDASRELSGRELSVKRLSDKSIYFNNSKPLRK